MSTEWVDAFNAALAGADLGTPGADSSLTAAGGRFRVTQVVRDVPGAGGEGEAGGEVRITLVVADGALRLVHGAAPGPEGAGGEGDQRSDVTVSLSYADAADLSRGALDPAGALAAGRVRVRGDLSVLMAAQQTLAAAAPLLGGLQAATTY